MAKRIVCVFEDKSKDFEVLRSVLTSGLDSTRYEIIKYPGEETPLTTEGPHAGETRVRGFLGQAGIALALVDWNLDLYNQDVSRGSIGSIVQELHIPLVVYQGVDPKRRAEEVLGRWQERRIAVEGTTEKIKVAAKCVDVANGFEDIWAKVSELEQPRLLETLRELLRPPASVGPLHLEQFAVGSQEPLDVLSRGAGDDVRRRAVATWMGYLIHNRILQFPGPLLGRTAAAAYLGIDESELVAVDVKPLLEEWRYQGPFATSLPSWWRWGLDEVVRTLMGESESQIPLGRTVLERKLERSLLPALCREDKHPLKEAGFLCILSRTPVCFEHSEAPDAWIPQGADLCRVASLEKDLLRGWLGL